MRKILLTCLTLLFVLVSTTAWAQDRTVSGKVTDESGLPLPGVSVLLKGTGTGAPTDIDGNYSLSVPASGGILVFNFLGYTTQEIEIGNRSVINIQLQPDVTSLGEVVVVGYGSQDVRALTGSITTVGSESIEKIPLSDVSRTLQGSVAGLMSTGASGTPGASAQVRIRGIGSTTASAAPLYILDGIAIESEDLSNNTATASPLTNINPNDIESITVLKDAASTAIYGSRGSNGVIIINTKQGKAGQTKVNVNAQFGWSDQAYQEYERLNRDEYIELREEALINAGVDPATAAVDAINGAADTNWEDVIFRTGRTNNYSVSLSGGDEKTTFFVSGGYFMQEGITIATNFDRLSARVNIEHKASDKLRVGMNMAPSYSRQDNTTSGATFNSLILQSMLLAPTAPIYNEDGTFFTGFPGLLGGGGYNPIAITSLDRRDNNVARIIGKMFADYTIIPDLTVRSELSIDFYNGTEQVYQNSQYGDGRTVQGRANVETQRGIIWQSTNTLNYNKSFGDVHDLNFTGVFETLGRSRVETSTTSEGFASDELRNPVSGANPATASGTETESSLVSFAGILRYEFNGRYFANASFRRDGSSRFGADVKYGSFWSFGGGWLISEESFMSGLDFVNSLKLRAGYGETGNESIGDFRSQGLFEPQSYNNSPAYIPSQIPNPELTWEKGNMINVGLDFRLLDGKISGSVEWYNRTTESLLFEVPVSRVTGFNNVIKNAASLENKGWEFTLNTTNIETGDLRWTTNFNIAFNKNEVIEIGGGQTEIIAGTKKRTVGHDWSEYYVARYAGANPATGAPMWYDADGNLVDTYSADLRVMTGKNATPDFFGGFTNRVTYKDFDLSAMFTFSYGAYLYDNFSFVYESNGRFMGENQKRTQLNRWQQPGDISQFPRRVAGSNVFQSATHTADLQDGSFIRLRNITLGYKLPSDVVSKVGLKSARVYLMGTNLLTFSAFDGLDPEQAVNGIDSFTYPNPRTVSVGLDVGL